MIEPWRRIGMSVNKRERLLRYLKEGRTGDYVPAAFFLHFGDENRQGEPAINIHKEFFAFTGMDFVKIQFELKFPQLKIEASDDFERLQELPLEQYRSQLEVVKGLVNGLKSDALVVLTLYSPFMILGQMAGQRVVIGHLEKDPEAVFKALETITNSLVEFVRECSRLGLDGFYHSTQGGEANRLNDPALFTRWVRPTDIRLMREIDSAFEFNILHICDYHQEYGGYSDLKSFAEYPGTVVNAPAKVDNKTVAPAEIAQFFGRPFMGGMDRLGLLSYGTEDEVRSAAREALMQLPPNAILAADCTVPGTTPWTNLRAAIDEAHHFAG